MFFCIEYVIRQMADICICLQMADATTTDNMVQIMMLKQQILNKFSLLEGKSDGYTKILS